MALEDIFGLLMPVTFVAFLLLERVIPARGLPRVPWWLAKGIVAFVLVAAINGAIPALVVTLLGQHTLLHLSALGTLGGVVLMLLVSDLVGYGIHRGLHTSERVWRWTHQLHHSAERMDMAGAAYFHPFDILLQQVLPGMLFVVVFGVTPLAAAVGGFLAYLLGVTPHLNVRTPAWLGYVFQRPEMHAIHHQRGVHAYNYGVLALSDLLFGTWRNPRTFPDVEYGFWDGASSRLGALLVGRDLARPRGE
jgi:sterol desaturase/sphingolipid hydroxylase (fatty acid hydroxylase superfamily)